MFPMRRWFCSESTIRWVHVVAPAMLCAALNGCGSGSPELDRLIADLKSDDRNVRYDAAKALEEWGANASETTV